MKAIRTIGMTNGGGNAPGQSSSTTCAVSAFSMGSTASPGPRAPGEMTEEFVGRFLPRCSAMVGTTNRGNPFAMEDGKEVAHDDSSPCIDSAHRLGIDVAMVIRRRLGVAACDLVARQEFGRMVCLKAGKMDSVSLDEALEKMKFIDPDSEIVQAAAAVRATIGDGR